MGKKDPGKFTVRFNIADPQQREVAELLNRQRRSKAQFLTSAVLNYVKGEGAAPPSPAAGIDSAEVERIVMAVPARGQLAVSGGADEAVSVPAQEPVQDWPGGLGDADMDSIRTTLEAFGST